MISDPVTAGGEPELAPPTAALTPVTLVALVRAAEALGLAPAALNQMLDRLRRSRTKSLARLDQAKALAETLGRGERPAISSLADCEALDLLFRATRDALADRAPGDRVAVEDAFVARADAVPCSLVRDIRTELAQAAPANRAVALDRVARLMAAAPRAASAFSFATVDSGAEQGHQE